MQNNLGYLTGGTPKFLLLNHFWYNWQYLNPSKNKDVQITLTHTSDVVHCTNTGPKNYVKMRCCVWFRSYGQITDLDQLDAGILTWNLYKSQNPQPNPKTLLPGAPKIPKNTLSLQTSWKHVKQEDKHIETSHNTCYVHQ